MSLHKAGLLGGTFNPVHSVHIELGQKALERFQLDKVFYLLSANPPHKRDGCFTGKEIRWEMLNESLKNYPSLIPSDIEMKRSGLSWSFETIKYLKAENPEYIYYFISGSEGFLNIKSWRCFRELLKEVVFIVALREVSHLEKVKKLLEELNIPVANSIDNAPPGVLLFSYESDKISYSSTEVRKRVSEGQDTESMVSDNVEEIIKENKLYER